jgi:Flp pilus assembly pilin Flp
MGTRATLQRLATQEDGQGLTEYALMFGFVICSVWALITLSGLGADIADLFSRVTAEVLAVGQ